ncbi:MAG: hypothetical protein HY609_03720 [Deltaproteobacteria bacterium]|nr:hypothetical protein [Deltaproteobacteria bacterium]
MLPGGEISRAVRRAIAEECRNRHPDQADLCAPAVAEKVTGEIEKFCDSHAAAQRISPSRCRKRLGSLVWLNWQDLERRLKRKMPKLQEALIGPSPFLASNGTTHRSLVTLIHAEAASFEPRPLPPPPPAFSSQSAPVPEPVEKPTDEKTVWEQPFSLLHSFTHVDEWVPLKTAILFHQDGVPTHKTIEWHYWLKKNSDDTYLLYWSLEAKTDGPKEADPHVAFKLANGHIPNNLRLIYSEPAGLRPFVKG